ncbi:iron complex transport system permease protein [Aneurinibacillus thermoaerophilus]|uniref:Iron complex transport system permease protein n=1 Tax=Aneurinibacillus thermoaerophilus TaxID=143495 RepID=A0A1G8AKV2_ANETH|nr:iron ABC transporter permease [Aneurinibacillus thermoaerophilus]SDH21537.1 iron complex transport system permease protein [Aneurinibacillus thermoaerophilus]
MNSISIKFKWTMLVLLVLLFLACLISLNLGVVPISPDEVLKTFIGNGTKQQQLILFEIRLPAIVLALLVGAGMAVSGTILQSITRNELADPGILGINAGAGVAVVIYITFFKTVTGSLGTFSTFALPLFSFLGALLTAGLIISLAWKRGFHSIRLILVGIGINAGFSAILIALQLRMTPNDFMQAMVWLSGDLWATQWKFVWALLPWFIVLIPYSLYKTHILNILNLGSRVATGLGIHTDRERLLLLILAVGLAGLGVAAGGGIAFLGLIAPHIARRLIGPNHHLLLPIAAILGSLILMLADTIGTNLMPPTEIPAGLVVSIVSAPYFIYLLMKK